VGSLARCAWRRSSSASTRIRRFTVLSCLGILLVLALIAGLFFVAPPLGIAAVVVLAIVAITKAAFK
jgi:hypothetical protein